MSDASVQFTEMVRLAHSRLTLRPGERWHWCQACGKDTPHAVADLDARREVFTCRCGSQSVYTVR